MSYRACPSCGRVAYYPPAFDGHAGRCVFCDCKVPENRSAEPARSPGQNAGGHAESRPSHETAQRPRSRAIV